MLMASFGDWIHIVSVVPQMMYGFIVLPTNTALLACSAGQWRHHLPKDIINAISSVNNSNYVGTQEIYSDFHGQH